LDLVKIGGEEGISDGMMNVSKKEKEEGGQNDDEEIYPQIYRQSHRHIEPQHVPQAPPSWVESVDGIAG